MGPRREISVYLLTQLPSWAIAAARLIALNRWVGLPAWLGALLLGRYVAKDLVLFPPLLAG